MIGKLFLIILLAEPAVMFAQQADSVKEAKTTEEALGKLVKVLQEHEMAEMNRHLGMVKNEFAQYTVFVQRRTVLTALLKSELTKSNKQATQKVIYELFRNKLDINSASNLLRTWGRDLLSNIHSNLTAGTLTEREAEYVIREYEGIKTRTTSTGEIPEELLKLTESAKAKYPSQATNFDIFWESYPPFREAFR